MMVQKIFPSVMAKNQQELNGFFKRLDGVAKTLHLDFADGKFVSSKSLWFPFRLSKKFNYNAHLMIKNPEQWIKKHGRKVDLCIVQWEVIKDKKKFIAWIAKRKKVAFALKPETKVSELKGYLQEIDFILILTVHPGFYGARYLRSPLKKIAQIKKINPKIKIIVDGGMNLERIKEAVKAGTDYAVSGSFISKADNPKERMRKLEMRIR